MANKEKPKFPKGFFTQPRPTISSKEALKDVIPINLNKEKDSKIGASKEKKEL